MSTKKFFNKMTLKGLVDTFSSLAGIKDMKIQAQLFVEDAKLGSLNGDPHSVQNGREGVETAYTSFPALSDTICHLNDQQIVDINETGDAATGTAYCHVVLIGENGEGKRVQTTRGVRYNDEYIEIDGEWKIASRAFHFAYIDTEET